MNLKYAKRSEDTEQIVVIRWAALQTARYPELKWLHHIPNGGSRNKAEAAKFKQMGVKSGVSDLCLPYPMGIYSGLYIEMKFGDNTLTDTQKQFLDDMEAAGNYVATCYTAQDAIHVLTEYCELNTFTQCFQTSESITRTTIGKAMHEQNNSVWKNGTVKHRKGKQ